MNSKREIRPKYLQVAIDRLLEPDGRLRLEIDQEGIENLAKSIQSVGLRQAIEIVPRGDKFEIVYGERRVLACRALGHKKIWAKVVDLGKPEIALIRATENIARDNLSPIEEAASYADLRDQFGMSVKKMAEHAGRGPGHVKRRLDLLKMSKSVQKAVHAGKLKVSVAEELWRCPDEAHREYLLDLSVEHGVTRDVVRQWVQEYAAKERRQETASVEGERELSPMQSKTIYHACECCDGATPLSEIITWLVCGECDKRLRNASK